MQQGDPHLNAPSTSSLSQSGDRRQQSTHSQQRADILLVVLLGLPGAGKTTLAAILCNAARRKQVHSHHLCLDELVRKHTAARSNEAAGNSSEEQTTIAFSTEVWQACRHELLQQAEAIMQRAHDEAAVKALDGPPQYPLQPQPTPSSCRIQPTTHHGHHHQQQQQQDLKFQSLPERVLVLVDDNNFYQSMRYQFLQLARIYAAAFLQVYLECPLELALDRNQGRDKTGCIPEAVLRRCASVFESPDPCKRHWEHGRTLTLQPGDVPSLVAARLDQDNNYCAADRLWLQLLDHWGPAVPSLPDPAELEALKHACTAANLSSRVHQADLASRAMLNAVLEHLPKEMKLRVAHDLNSQRKCMLQHLRRSTPAAANGVVEEFVQAFHQLCLSKTAHSLP